MAYIKIGDDIPEGYNKPFILDLERFIPKLIPPATIDFPVFDPAYYFITSGDALQKMKQLRRDLYAYAGAARKLANQHESKPINEFEALCWKAAGGALSLINALEKARSTNVFLETEWDEHTLITIPKNPRIKP